MAPTHHRDCQPSGAFFNFVHIKASCCTGNPEYMFAYSISQGRLAVDTSSGGALYLANTPLRFVVGVCEVVLSSRYKGAFASHQHAEHGLSEAAGAAVRDFSKGNLTLCREILGMQAQVPSDKDGLFSFSQVEQCALARPH